MNEKKTDAETTVEGKVANFFVDVITGKEFPDLTIFGKQHLPLHDDINFGYNELDSDFGYHILNIAVRREVIEQINNEMSDDNLVELKEIFLDKFSEGSIDMPNSEDFENKGLDSKLVDKIQAILSTVKHIRCFDLGEEQEDGIKILPIVGYNEDNEGKKQKLYHKNRSFSESEEKLIKSCSKIMAKAKNFAEKDPSPEINEYINELNPSLKELFCVAFIKYCKQKNPAFYYNAKKIENYLFSNLTDTRRIKDNIIDEKLKEELGEERYEKYALGEFYTKTDKISKLYTERSLDIGLLNSYLMFDIYDNFMIKGKRSMNFSIKEHLKNLKEIGMSDETLELLSFKEFKNINIKIEVTSKDKNETFSHVIEITDPSEDGFTKGAISKNAVLAPTEEEAVEFYKKHQKELGTKKTAFPRINITKNITEDEASPS